MGTADSSRFRASERPFKRGGKGRKAKIFPTGRLDKRICRVGENLRKTRLWRMCDELPDRRKTGRETSMSQGLIWLYAIAQGLGVLALNVALRVLVS